MMWKQRACISLLCALCVYAVSLPFVQSARAASATDRLNDFFKNVKSLRAEFQQTVFDPRMQPTHEAKGTFVMQRPNKFRWSYRQPYEQVIVADGARLWVYDKDLEQVTVKKLDEALGNTPALLLTGGRALTQDFRAKDLAPQADGLQRVELEPIESDTSFSVVRLAFGAGGLELMELVDSFGQTTRLRFTNVRANAATTREEFAFTPPAGVDVIGDER
jgi:outer membrane lipoprotein carrier protein